MDACQVIDERLHTVHRGRVLRASMVFVLIAVVLTASVCCFAIGVARVKGDSMYPSFRDGDLVMYQRFGTHVAAGDVVTFHDENATCYIKRVEALAGEAIGGTKGIGSEQKSSSYTYEVPEGCVYVLGDNQAVSLDSRVMGPIREDSIDGVVFMTIRL